MADVSILNVLGENINIKDNYKKIISSNQFGLSSTSSANDFVNAVSYCITNDKILFLEKDNYNFSGIGLLEVCDIYSDGATISFGDNDQLQYGSNITLRGLNFVTATFNANGFIYWKNQGECDFINIENCNFTGEKNNACIRVLSNKAKISCCNFSGFTSGIIQSNVAQITPEQYEYDNLYFENCDTGIDIEGYINSSQAIGRLKNIAINNISHINTVEQRVVGVGHDAILISFTDNFSIHNLTCDNLGERAIYCNTCSNGTISNINAQNTGCLKIAGQNNASLNAFAHDITVSNLYNDTEINCGDQSVDIYDAENISINGFYFRSPIINANTNGFIRLRNQLKNISIKNGHTVDGYRGAITFEASGNTNMSNITLMDIDIENPRVGASGPIISTSLTANNQASDIIIDDINVLYNTGNLGLLSQVFMNVSYFNNIMIRNCDIASCLFPTFTNSTGTQFVNNIYWGNERSGFNTGMASINYNSGNTGIYFAAANNLASRNFHDYGNGVSFTVYEAESANTYVELPRGSTTAQLCSVIGRGLNTVFWYQSGAATRITGDTPTISSGKLLLPTTGNYLIITVGF